MSQSVTIEQEATGDRLVARVVAVTDEHLVLRVRGRSRRFRREDGYARASHVLPGWRLCAGDLARLGGAPGSAPAPSLRAPHTGPGALDRGVAHGSKRAVR